jgi:hypothetical protein
VVLDPLREHAAAVELDRQPRPERCPRAAGLAHGEHGLGGRADGDDLGVRQPLAQEAAALRGRLRVGEDPLDAL